MKIIWSTLALALLLSTSPVKADEISSEGLTTGADFFVRPQMKDPESARFSHLHGVSYESGDLMCGLVNAKNSFGGYSGSVRFIVFVPAPFQGQVLYETSSPAKSFDKLWAKCG